MATRRARPTGHRGRAVVRGVASRPTRSDADRALAAASKRVKILPAGVTDELLENNEAYAAIESDLENLYFWHGVFVPAFVVVKPEWITTKHVLSEENVEVRRVMIERMGMERFLQEAGASEIHKHDMGDLFSIDLPKDDPEGVLRAVRVKDPSTGRIYFLRVPPTISRADDAVGDP